MAADFAASLEIVYEYSLIKDVNATFSKEYTEWMRMSEFLKMRGSCKWKHGCACCSYEHAIRYVLRHGKPPPWWHSSTRSVLSSGSR